MPGERRQLTADLPISHGTRLAGQAVVRPRVREPGNARNEVALAREIRARETVAGQRSSTIAACIYRECKPAYGTSWIRAYRLALGIALADVVAQVRARYEAEGRTAPRFSETLLSAYESGQKRPGPEYLHYLCAVYGADPQDLGYQGRCFCGTAHAAETGAKPDCVVIPRVASLRAAPRAASRGTMTAVSGTGPDRTGISGAGHGGAGNSAAGNSAAGNSAAGIARQAVTRRAMAERAMARQTVTRQALTTAALAPRTPAMCSVTCGSRC